MKNSIYIKRIKQSMLAVLLFSASFTNAQVLQQRSQKPARVVVARPATPISFQHTAAKKNTQGHITALNHSAVNGLKNKIVFITHNYGRTGPYLTQPLGVYFSGGKWRIFSQNKAPMKMGAKFNVLVHNRSRNAFVHTAARNNISIAATKLSHASLNGKPNAAFIITQNWGSSGPYNASHTGVKYSGGFWYIYNLDGKAMPVGAKFNVLVNFGAFQHKPSASNIRNHGVIINTSKTNGQNRALVFTTFNAQNTQKNYNNAIGVHYINNRWSVFNENRAKLRGNEVFNILVINTLSQARRTTSRSTTVARRQPVSVKTNPRVTNRGTARRVVDRGVVRARPFRPSNSGSNERQGPKSKSLPENFSSVMDSEQFDLFKETFNLDENIFRDANPRANIYYYVPADYSLKWTEETNKYDFNVYYMSAEDRSKGSVLINVELTSNIDAEDIKLAEDFLSSKLGKKTSLLSMDLRDNPEVNFGSFLNIFNVDSGSISTSVPSDYQKPIILDWKMESGVDNFVGAMLNNKSGNVMIDFKPHGDSLKVVKVPINLKVNDHKTYGKIKFDALNALTQGWTNYLDYPITVKRLILLCKNGNRKYFKAIPLTRESIAAGNMYTLNDANVKSEIPQAANVVKIWLDYEIDSECEDCNQKVKRKLIGGTSGSEILDLEIQALNAIEYSGANMIKLMLKSTQGDPNGIKEIKFPTMDVSEDGQALDPIQLFVPQGKELSYSYQVILVMDDGDILTSKWKQGNSNLLILGENQIKDLFPNKKKNDLINNTKERLLEKAKDSILGDATEGDIVDKGLELIGGLFKKKKDSVGDKKKDKDNDNNDEEGSNNNN